MTTPPDKLYGLLGMCRRSGKMTVGFDAVAALCKTPHTHVFFAADASPKTVKELRFRFSGVPLYRLPLAKAQVAHAAGFEKEVAVLAITDDGFAKAMFPLCEKEYEEESRL